MANLVDFVDATIKNGGASYNLWSGELNPKDGYMVASQGREVKVNLVGCETEDDARSVIKNAIVCYLADNADMLALEKMYLGSWIDKDTLYLDFSHKMQDKSTALWAGRMSKQIAIWDNKNQVEIRIQSDEKV